MSDSIKMNTNVLAWIGDAVYELSIRKYVVDTGQIHADRLHSSAVEYVKADSQALIMKDIFASLSEEEQTLVKRAKNRKSKTKAKNADPVDYKWATAFEALIGYYYIEGKTEKMDAIISRAVELIDNR